MSEEETYCEYMTYRATLEQPAEYCENETLPGEDYCEEHMPWEPDYEPLDLFYDDDLEPLE